MRIGPIHVYTDGVSPPDRALTGATLVASAADAVSASVERSRIRQVADVPDGPYLAPGFQATA